MVAPQFRDRPDAAMAAMDVAIAARFDGVYVFDHLWPLGGDPSRPALECWTLVGALAGRARLGGQAMAVGTIVTRAGLRPPALLGRMAATVGAIAGASAIVGVGAGDAANRHENEAFGFPYAQAAGRAAAVEAAVAGLRAADSVGPAPEVWVGGTSTRMQDLAGTLGDAWNAWGVTPGELSAGLARVREAAERAGRDPLSVGATWGGQVVMAEDAGVARERRDRWAAGRSTAEAARTLSGDPAAVLSRLTELHAAGATWCVLSLIGGPDLASLTSLTSLRGFGTSTGAPDPIP